MPNNVVKKTLFRSIPILVVGLIVFTNYQEVNAQSLPTAEKMVSERILGNQNALVEVIEYASLTCPHCAAFHNGPWPTLKKEFLDTGKIKLIYRDFPTDQLALAASMIAKCAPESRYFSLIKLMFRTQDKWRKSRNPREALSTIGRLAGMSQATIDACMNNQAVLDGVLKQREEGIKKFNIDATPTLIVNGEKLEAGLTLEEFREKFNKAHLEAGEK